MNKFLILIATFCFLGIAAQETKPNVLVILVDDMGFDDLSIHGNTVSQTPHIDKLGSTSVQFSNFMVNSVCAPTRASLLTGRDFWRTGVGGLHAGKDFLHLNEKTMGTIFKENGYATGFWGKWHNGKSDGYWAWDRGFDEAYQANLYKYYPSNGNYNEYPKKTVHKDKWSPEVLADYTIDFINRHKNEPFLAYLSFLSVHEIWNTPDTYKNKYVSQGHSEKFSMLLGMLEYMDMQVGRILDHLENMGLSDNTIVVFMSDNGPNKGKPKAKNPLGTISEEEWQLRNNHDYAGNKSKLWVNGLKSPLFVKWGKNYQPNTVNRLVTITDILPTLVEICGLKLTNDQLDFDGRSVQSYLKGNTSTLSEKTGVFANWHPIWEGGHYQPIENKSNLDFSKQRLAIINEEYKYIQNEYNTSGAAKVENKIVLIDTKQDKQDKINIAKQHPKTVTKLQDELKGWFHQIQNEAHSFTAPKFQIGWNGKTESEILAFAPKSVVGLKNEGHRIGGWDTQGDQAVYNINIHQEGWYEFDLKTIGSTKDLVFELRTETHTNEGRKIYLEASSKTLSLTLKEANTSNLKAITHIKLKRI